MKEFDHIPREAIIGEFADYDALIARLRERVGEIGMSYRLLEELTGLGEGNIGKYLSDTRAKHFTMSSVLAITKALAVKGIFVEDQQLREQMAQLWEKGDGSKAHARRYALGPVTIKRVLPSVAAEMGRRGGIARREVMTPEQRRLSAQRASLARWRKPVIGIRGR